MCNNDIINKHKVDSVAAWAIKEGKWAGIVTSTRVTHATPAGAYAHTGNRHWECDVDVKGSGSCKDIASQLVEDFPGNKFKVKTKKSNVQMYIVSTRTSGIHVGWKLL